MAAMAALKIQKEIHWATLGPPYLEICTLSSLISSCARCSFWCFCDAEEKKRRWALGHMFRSSPVPQIRQRFDSCPSWWQKKLCGCAMWQWFRLPILTQLDIPAVDHDHLSREDSNTQWILFNSFFKPQLFELWVLDSPRLLTSFHSWSSWSSKSASIGCRRLAASSVSEKPSASVWMDDALFHGYPYGYPYMAIAGKLMNHGMEWDGMGWNGVPKLRMHCPFDLFFWFLHRPAWSRLRFCPRPVFADVGGSQV